MLMREGFIMKKFAKYMGITAAALLAVAPIAAPVINASTEVTAEATTVSGDVLNQVNAAKVTGDITSNEDGTYNFTGSVPAVLDGKASSINVSNVTLTPGESRYFDDPEIPNYTPSTDHGSGMYELYLSEDASEVILFTFPFYDLTNNAATPSNTPGTSLSLVFSPSIDAQTYDDNGNVTAITLLKASAWQIDRQMDINGTTYYRVATNEWVKKTDGIEVTPREGQIDTNKVSSLYTSTGKKVTNRALAAHTGWYTDRMATINGQIMYRIATDEWISISDTQYAAF